MPIIKKKTTMKTKTTKKSTTKRSIERTPRSHLGSLELMLLLTVARLKDKAHGSSIVTHIQKSTSVQTRIGAVYTSLSRMMEKKFIKAKMGKSTPVRGGRAKKFSALTVAGKKAMDKSVQAIRKLAA